MAEVYLSYHRERGEVHLNRPSVFHNRWKTTFSSLHHCVFRRILTSVSWDCERAQNSSERPLLTFDIWTQSLLAAWKEWQFQGLILHFVYLFLHLQSSCINTLTWSVSYQPSNLSFVSWFNQWHKSLTHYDLNWFSPCYCQVWSLLFLGKINQPKHTQLNATFFCQLPCTAVWILMKWSVWVVTHCSLVSSLTESRSVSSHFSPASLLYVPNSKQSLLFLPFLVTQSHFIWVNKWNQLGSVSFSSLCECGLVGAGKSCTHFNKTVFLDIWCVVIVFVIYACVNDKS